MTVLPIYEGLDAARAAILASRQFGEMPLPDAVRARIRAVFDADLTAEQVVARVVADVRAEGDVAVRRYGEAFDGVTVAAARVGEAEIQAAVAGAPPALAQALEVSARQVAAFHERRSEERRV